MGLLDQFPLVGRDWRSRAIRAEGALTAISSELSGMRKRCGKSVEEMSERIHWIEKQVRARLDAPVSHYGPLDSTTQTIIMLLLEVIDYSHILEAKLKDALKDRNDSE